MRIDRNSLRPSKKTAFRGFWVGLFLLALAALFSVREPALGGVLGGALIVAAAFFPAYTWIHHRNGSIPVFPLWTALMAVTHGLPLLIAPDIVMEYSSKDQFIAGVTVAFPLFLGTLAWRFVRRIKREPPTAFREIPGPVGDKFFLVVLALGAVVVAGMTAGQTLSLQEGVFSVIRAATLACGALACLVFGYRHGRNLLTRPYRIAYVILLAVNVVAFSASLLLNLAISYLVLAFIGFALGRQKIPWAVVIPVVLVFSVLHAGKGEMRQHHWYGGGDSFFTPAQYPGLFAEWTAVGVNNLQNFGDQSDSASLLNRAGLVWLLLHVQAVAPERTPFLNGLSYRHIPELLLPRLLHPGKPDAHEGTILLNVHFGLQTLDSVATATIGWGLFNESYANFGFPGCVIFFVGMGTLLALIERWSAGLPLLSFRALFTILLLNVLVTADPTAGVLIAALVQGTIVLVAASVVLMNTRRVKVDLGEIPVGGKPLLGSR